MSGTHYAASHAPIVAILFVSRKALAEARLVLIESVEINVSTLARYKWPTHPLNTNFRIGDILQHVVFNFWACQGDCLTEMGRSSSFRNVGALQLLRNPTKLPVLRSLTIQLSGHDHFVRVAEPGGKKEIQTAVEDTAKICAGSLIIGCECQGKIIRAARRAHCQRDHAFALKAQSALMVNYAGDGWEATDHMVCIRF